MTTKQIVSLAKRSFSAWSDDYAPSMGAALSYYTVFSLAPLLIVVIAVAGLAFGADAARGAILDQLKGLLGPDGAKGVQDLLESASKPSRGVTASILGAATLVLGATSVFGELQSALDRIWHAPPAPGGGIIGMVKNRFLSFGLVVAVGFLLVVSLVVSAALAAFGKWWGAYFPAWDLLLQTLNFIVSFLVVTVMFALIYKVLPRVKVTWRDVWVGAAVTSALFTLGKFLIGLYLGHADVASGFGAAGSIALLFVWIYYSAQIFLLGAEFTWLFAHEHGSKIGQIPASQPMTSAASNTPRRIVLDRAPIK